MENDVGRILWKKILLKEFFQQMEVVSSRIHISDKAISESSGQSPNWFNDAKNNQEDIQISSFIRVLSVLTDSKNLKLSAESTPQKIPIEEIYTNQLIWLGSVFNGLKVDKDISVERLIESYIKSDPERLNELIATLSGLKTAGKLSEEEKKFSNKLITMIENNKGAE